MSYPERKVVEFLKKMNIEWTYEQPVFVWNDDGRSRVWAPAVYLAQLSMDQETLITIIKNGFLPRMDIVLFFFMFSK